MQKSTQKNLYLAVAAGLGAVSLVPISASAAPAIDAALFFGIPLPSTPADSLTNNAVTVQATAGDVTVVSDTGQVGITGATTATLQGNTQVTVFATAGDANVTGNSNVNITATNGAATVSGGTTADVTANGGDATVSSTTAAANLTGQTGVNATTTNGVASLRSTNGAATVSGGTTADITANGGNATVRSTTAAAHLTGQTGVNATTTNGTASLRSTNGAVAVSGGTTASLTGQTGVNATTFNGTAILASTVSDARVSAGTNIGLNAGNDVAVTVDANNGGAGGFVINDYNNAVGGRVNTLTVDADDGMVGNFADATKSSNWTLDENGRFEVNVQGSNSNTTTLTAASTQNSITDGTNTTFRNQTATAQYDEAKDDVVGGNIASRNQTKSGQTDRAAVGGNSAERRQTATTQDDEIISGANSNRLASNVGNSTRTIVGAGGTTTVSQDNRDWIASTGAGAGSARVAVRNSGGAGNSTAELSVTNSAGNTHGVFVGENSTRISGGTNSTSLAFDDNGAHFRNDSTGGPARVTGIADGVADFDAVNFRQLNNLDKKLTGKINETGAVAAAFAQLGQAQTPGKSTFGIAAGGQGSKAGVALGFSHRPVTMKPVVIKASLGASGKTVAGGVGATWEF
jgi:hypothetical protein